MDTRTEPDGPKRRARNHADADRIADALGALLRRGLRAQLYGDLVEGVHENVTVANYPVVSGLARFGPVSAAALAAELEVDRSFVSRRAAQLARAGLVTSEPDPADARATLLDLTARGQQVVALLRTRLTDVVDQRLGAWTAADRRQLADLLSRFAADLTDSS